MRRRFLMATLVSAALHALVVLASVFDLFKPPALLDVPKIELEWAAVTMLDPDELQGQGAPEPPPEPPAPPQPPPQAPAPEPETGSEPAPPPPEKKKKKKPRAFGHRTSKIDQLGPSAANFYLLLANKRLRKLPFAEEAIDVMAPMYDFRFLVHGAGFHPFQDFDYIVIASPNLLDVTQTFLAVQTRLPRAELIKGLDRAAAKEGLVNRWSPRGKLLVAEPVPIDPAERDWDPRWLVLTEDDILVYVRPEYLPQLEAGPSASRKKTAGNFVAKIARLRRFAATEPRAGLQIVVRDINASLKSARVAGGGALPFGVPDDLELMVEASSKPRSVVKLRFPDETEATRAVSFWEERLGEAISRDPRLKFIVGPLYRATKLEHKADEVVLRNTFGTVQARELLKVLGGISQKMNGPSKEDVRRLREEREQRWDAREGGKRTPSEVLEQESTSPRAPAEGGLDGATPDDAASDDAAPDDPTPNDIKPDDPTPNDIKPDGPTPNDIKPDDVRPDDVSPDDASPPSTSRSDEPPEGPATPPQVDEPTTPTGNEAPTGDATQRG